MDAKHQFKYTYNDTHLEEFSPVEITVEMPGEITLNQMLYNFESYLKACGFYFDGHLEIVDETLDNIDTCDEIYGCMADFDKDVLDESEDRDDDCENHKSDKIKEWNEGLKKLENELKAKRDIEQQAYERAARNASVIKNNWVHGMCNPPSPDWKKK